MSRTGNRHCNNKCVAPRCKGLSKKSVFKSRCCLCTKHASNLCHWHRRYDGPEVETRAPARAATLGNGVEAKPSGIAAAGTGLFATVPFASNDIITRYEPDAQDHRGHGSTLSKATAMRLPVQTHIMQKDGIYVSGTRAPVQGKGGGPMANDNGGPYNAESFVHNDRLDHIYLKVLAGKVIKPGQEVFIKYGTAGARDVAMGSRRMT